MIFKKSQTLNKVGFTLCVTLSREIFVKFFGTVIFQNNLGQRLVEWLFGGYKPLTISATKLHNWCRSGSYISLSLGPGTDAFWEEFSRSLVHQKIVGLFVKEGRLPLLSLSKLGEKLWTIIILGNFVKKP